MESKSQHQEEKLRNMNSSLTSGFGYSDVSSAGNSSIPIHLMNQIQTIDSNPDQLFNLTTNMEMIGYFPPANDHDQNSTGVTDQDHSNSWQENNHRLLVDDSSLIRCVFAGGDDQGNDHRTSQGLSLSLSSINPSTAGFESFDLRHNNSSTSPIAHHQIEDHQVMYLSSTPRFQGIQPAGHEMLTDGFLGKVSNLHIHQHGLHQFQIIRNSKYLKPAQELLNEFCSLSSKQSHHYHHQKKASKQKVHGSVNQWDHNELHVGTSSNTESSRNHNHLYSLQLLELQKRKAQLLSMLEEVDRRYKHYCDQMKAVVSSFEAAAGNGAATVYSALASKAMSRHFRCLRDGIIEQIQATKKAMGEKDDQVVVALGTTRGETPRLRLLDQTLRQQKAFQQLNMIETHPWRPQRGLPERSVSFLRAWLFEHFLHPYPTDVDKHILARQTGLSRSQVSNWFINARVRLWKPMVEEMYMEETKEELAENTNTSSNNNNLLLISSSSTFDRNNVFMPPNNVHNMSSHLAPMRHHHHHQYEDDQKPTLDQLIPIDSDCLSSIINHNNSSINPIAAYNNHTSTNTGAIELDFSSYNPSQNFNCGGASGVSLTLGLQQHGDQGGGVSLAYHNNPSAGASSHGTLFYGPGRDSIDECQTMQYTSVMDGNQGHNNLPYRNLMGAQLLHDLAG